MVNVGHTFINRCPTIVIFYHNELSLVSFNMCVASISLERSWICAQRVMPRLLIAVQHLLWLYTLSWCQLIPLSVKPLFLVSLLQPLHLQHDQSLATSSHFSMSITLMSLLILKQRWCCLCTFLKMISSQHRRILRILPCGIQCICPSPWSRHCWRRMYKLGNWAWVRTLALVTQLNQLMLRMHLKQWKWKALRCISCLE